VKLGEVKFIHNKIKPFVEYKSSSIHMNRSLLLYEGSDLDMYE
jgi:hypothetical protein